MKSVQVALSELNMPLFDLVQSWTLCIYIIVCVFLLYVYVNVCCSNCDVVCICYELCVFVGVGMSDVYMLESVALCGTPVLNWC